MSRCDVLGRFGNRFGCRDPHLTRLVGSPRTSHLTIRHWLCKKVLIEAEGSSRTRLGQFLGLEGLRPRLDRELRNASHSNVKVTSSARTKNCVSDSGTSSSGSTPSGSARMKSLPSFVLTVSLLMPAICCVPAYAGEGAGSPFPSVRSPG